MNVRSQTPGTRLASQLAWRAAAIASLAVAELPVVALLFDPLAINASDPLWLAMRGVLRPLVPAVVLFGVALLIVLAPERKVIMRDYDAAAAHDGRAFLFANLALFGALSIGALALNRAAGEPPWTLFALWVAGVAVMLALLALAAAPAAFWRDLARGRLVSVMLAAGASSFVMAASALSQQSWNGLSRATFGASAFLLSLYESDVIVEPAQRVLGASGFKVNIAAACSGYEGIGLTTAFLAVYLFVFRRTLRFPNAWLLFPIGIALIWGLNAARIAALVSIGAHVSEEVAIGGFHSQAGWLMFLAVTIGIMLASQRLAFFARHGARAPSLSGRAATALLAPFLAVTAAGILIAAFSADGGVALYGVKAAAGAAAILWFCRSLDPRRWISGQGALIGLAVGFIWVLTDPARGDASPAGEHLAGLSAAGAGLWIATRGLGAVLIIPIAEELAFRGYLHRALIARRFEDAAEAAFSWPAFLISSVLFGAVHGRWLAGALAGAVFALALYRTGRIGGAISAHASANLVIFLWALAASDWALL